MSEASSNLTAPEIAPASTVSAAQELPADPEPPASEPPSFVALPRQRPLGKGTRLYDARSARRSGRTLQFATRVSPEFDDRLRKIARRDGLLLVEVLEAAIDAYEEKRQLAAS